MEGLKRVAVFCILKNKNRFLLLKRANEPNIGKMVPVGGKINPFETPYNAVIRETLEETGILLQHVKFCGVLTETSPTEYNWVSFIYTSDIENVAAPYCDEGILSWVDENELENLNTPPTDWHIYQYIAHNLPFVFSAEYDQNLTMLMMKDELTGIILSKRDI